MDLRARLDRYEVTVVPLRRGGLTVVWSEPDDEAEPSPDERARPGAALAILDEYRITRIPSRAAS